MRFSTILTVLAAGVMAFAGAVPEIVTKRSATQMQNSWTALGDKCNNILPKLGNCGNDACTNSVSLELRAAIDECTSDMGGIVGGIIATPELAGVIARIISVSGDKLPGAHSTHTPFSKSQSPSRIIRTAVAAGVPACSLPMLESTSRSPLAYACASACASIYPSSSPFCEFLTLTSLTLSSLTLLTASRVW